MSDTTSTVVEAIKRAWIAGHFEEADVEFFGEGNVPTPGPGTLAWYDADGQLARAWRVVPAPKQFSFSLSVNGDFSGSVTVLDGDDPDEVIESIRERLEEHVADFDPRYSIRPEPEDFEIYNDYSGATRDD